MAALHRGAGVTMRPEELPYGVRKDPRRSAEVKLYDAMKSQLGAGWIVFYSVAWLLPTHGGAPQDGETDFVVAHPDKGVLLIEVKGGRIRYDGDRRQWISQDRHGNDHDIDPIGQVRKSKHALLEKLKSQPAIGTRWIDLSHAIAFTDVPRPKQSVVPDAPPEIIIGMDDIPRIAARIQEVLSYTAPGSTRQFKDGHLIVSELKRMLGATTVIRNPLSAVTAEEDREIVRLTREQFRVLDTLSRMRRVTIGGCAGSGKTFLAAEKAKRLAGENFRTLLTCFNRGLANYLATVTQGTPNLDVMTFHSLCKTFLTKAGLETPGIKDYPDALMQALPMLPDRRYDAIVVDEAQDFQDDWWIALGECLQVPAEGILYVFYDSHQGLYRGRGSLPPGLQDVPLVENIRNTRSIHDVLIHHYQGEDTPKSRGPVGRTVETDTYHTPAELKQVLTKVLRRLLFTETFSSQDVVVLTPRALDRSALQNMALPNQVQLVTTDSALKPHQVLLSTIYQFKGLERRVVIVAELDDQLPADMEERARLCYVAFSRPRTHLILLGTHDVLPLLIPPAS